MADPSTPPARPNGGDNESPKLRIYDQDFIMEIAVRKDNAVTVVQDLVGDEVRPSKAPTTRIGHYNDTLSKIEDCRKQWLEAHKEEESIHMEFMKAATAKIQTRKDAARAENRKRRDDAIKKLDDEQRILEERIRQIKLEKAGLQNLETGSVPTTQTAASEPENGNNNVVLISGSARSPERSALDFWSTAGRGSHEGWGLRRSSAPFIERGGASSGGYSHLTG
ncbi:hypothetical protein BKA67DRAFT_653907 [Truncatella angustata]|uniref:Uncharacterized protein n=1 Tax=Truncatella angustata TaxID=152316 RepID=A0A9P8UY96_9PEZI|nr:uncharacterized protein BKA67DRAFT_653907 [Truncatella angustata]KAH6660746.1 hypothetical protein BKA67DRAFT_653907 [Truncatella angustata]KAH8202992.1 hypothetical protein TruAng_002826 [Truncatella angustata]